MLCYVLLIEPWPVICQLGVVVYGLSVWKTMLTHWGRVTHICVSRLTITGSDNGLSPGRRQAIIWTNAGILLIGPLGTNISENSIEILTFSFTKMRLKVSSAKWRPFCLGLNVLNLNNQSISQSISQSMTPEQNVQNFAYKIFVVHHCERIDLYFE